MKHGLFIIAVFGLALLTGCSLVESLAAPGAERVATVVNGTIWQKTDGEATGMRYLSFKRGDTFYAYGGDGGSAGGGFKGFYVYTSTDLVNWTTGPMVLGPGSDPELYSCKLEAMTVVFNPNTNKYIMWMHYENANDYSLGRVAVAISDTPDGSFRLVRGSFRPLGATIAGKSQEMESRDMSIFVDDDNTAYLISSSNAGNGTNADLIIYRLTKDFLAIDKQLTIVYAGKSREAPSMTRVGDYYYLFTSGASGWYPNQAMYSFATAMDGPWSDLQPIADPTSFNGQNGGVAVFKGSEVTSRLIMYNRWNSGGSGLSNATQVWAPLTLDGPKASVEYFDKLSINLETGKVTGLPDGNLLSQGKTASASNASAYYPASLANDGDYATRWIASSGSWTPTPWWCVDLGDSHEIRNVQISWWTYKGSEAYYKYLIETSQDGTNFTTALDRSGSRIYGFTSDTLPAGTNARYVRVKMLDAVLFNNPSNWYTPTLWEVKVYGN